MYRHGCSSITGAPYRTHQAKDPTPPVGKAYPLPGFMAFSPCTKPPTLTGIPPLQGTPTGHLPSLLGPSSPGIRGPLPRECTHPPRPEVVLSLRSHIFLAMLGWKCIECLGAFCLLFASSACVINNEFTDQLNWKWAAGDKQRLGSQKTRSSS